MGATVGQKRVDGRERLDTRLGAVMSHLGSWDLVRAEGTGGKIAQSEPQMTTC